MKVRDVLILGIGLTIGIVFGLLLNAVPAGSGAAVVPGWLEVAHRVGTAVGGLGGVVALMYVVRQFNLLRQQSDLVQKNTRAALDGQLYARLDSFNRFIVEHDTEYELLDSLTVGESEAGHRAKLHHLCDLGFTFYEQVFKHHVRYDLLETEDWEEWQQNMAHFFAKTYVRGYWRQVRDRYAKSFGIFADTLVSTPPAPPA